MIVPSPDPVSVAITVASGIVALASRFVHIGAGRAEADVIVPVQNDLGRQLDVISDAFNDTTPDSLEQLESWRDQVQQLGEDFYRYTLGFPRAGQGARDTILGELINGEWVPTDRKPGWLTRLLKNIIRKIEEVLGMDAQLGFDWRRLLDIGIDIGNQVLQRPSGYPQYIPPPAQQVPVPATGQQQWPDWVLPVAIGGGLLIVAVVASASGGRR